MKSNVEDSLFSAAEFEVQVRVANFSAIFSVRAGGQCIVCLAYGQDGRTEEGNTNLQEFLNNQG